MGSDRSPAILFKAIGQAVDLFPEIDFIAFATQAVVDEIYSGSSHLFRQGFARFAFHIVSDVIEMHDEPLEAIRQKKTPRLPWDSSCLKNAIWMVLFQQATPEL